jgi:pimeloyl-ACP methyl ester carboxylesterase
MRAMPPTYHARNVVFVEHELEVALDHERPDGDRITIFARELADPDGRDKPFLVFFEGGPGHEPTRPTRSSRAWIDRALAEFRVLLLDQRGTGRSAPVGTLPGMSAREQAEYLTHFRADSIVRDAELFREALGAERWSVLGQSFGGLCVTAYLSIAPEGLKEALISAGLPPLGRPVDDVYRSTWARTLDRNRSYFSRYPGDRARTRALVERLDSDPPRLPSGDVLTSRRLRQAGNVLGMSYGAEQLHGLLELPPGSPAFLHDAEAATNFARNPLYAILHEACWADGGATRWAASRTMPERFSAQPELLYGEHVFPWMFQEIGALEPLREAAHLLAAHEWPRLYDEDVLRTSDVPCAAAIWSDDLYVPREFSEETAALIPGLRPWLTNEYDHDALRDDGARILGRLLDLARGRA